MAIGVVNLGGLDVSAQGLGCLGMSQSYGMPDWDGGIATIHRALELGVTFLDTADLYGAGHNEVLVGRAIVGRRDEVQLATKFGIDDRDGPGTRRRRGTAGYVRQARDHSLRRLGVDVIDLYYLHRPPQDAQIEETVGAMADLVAQGKCASSACPKWTKKLLRRACAVHPVAALQSEYSLWTRDPEALAPALRELGVGLVPFSPLGRGFLTGTLSGVSFDPGDFRSGLPRFVGPARDANEVIARAVSTAELDAIANRVTGARY